MRAETDRRTLPVIDPGGMSHAFELHAPEVEGNRFYGAPSNWRVAGGTAGNRSAD